MHYKPYLAGVVVPVGCSSKLFRELFHCFPALRYTPGDRSDQRASSVAQPRGNITKVLVYIYQLNNCHINYKPYNEV